jgi:hypothetical protein
MSKKIVAVAAFAVTAVAAGAAFAIQQTFTTMRPVSCLYTTCTQQTTDGTITLSFDNTSPLSGPTPTGFRVNAPDVDILPSAPNTRLDMTILTFTIQSSTSYNGLFYFGTVLLQTYDAATDTWKDVTAWSAQVGKSKYILLNGYNPSQPKIQGVPAIRLVGINGTTSFTINMANLTAY